MSRKIEVDPALLDGLSEAERVMAVATIQKNRIPVEWHERFFSRLVGYGWSARAGTPGSIENRGAKWWDEVSPERDAQRRREREYEKQMKGLRFTPFDNIRAAVKKAIGSTAALETMVKTAGDGFVRYSQADLHAELRMLEDYAAKLEQATERFRAAIGGNGVIDGVHEIVINPVRIGRDGGAA